MMISPLANLTKSQIFALLTDQMNGNVLPFVSKPGTTVYLELNMHSCCYLMQKCLFISFPGTVRAWVGLVFSLISTLASIVLT